MNCLPTLFLVTIAAWSGAEAVERPCVLVVVGAEGAEEYGEVFERSASLWEEAAKAGGADLLRIGIDDEPELAKTEEEAAAAATVADDRELLQTAIAERGGESTEPLWIVLIGHGTFDGRESKFNLRGPDVSDSDFTEWLKLVQRPVVFINCGSSSGPFVAKLSGQNRIILTATRSGDEMNYARFGEYLAESINDPAADLDKDAQVSVLEAWLTASARVTEFYRSGSRLATEHALLDDNGDGLGTQPDWFQGIRAIKRAKEGAAADGVRARQIHLVPSPRERALPDDVRQRRDALELEIAALRDEKSKLDETEYYGRLRSLMLELARLYEGIKQADGR